MSTGENPLPSDDATDLEAIAAVPDSYFVPRDRAASADAIAFVTALGTAVTAAGVVAKAKIEARAEVRKAEIEAETRRLEITEETKREQMRLEGGKLGEPQATD